MCAILLDKYGLSRQDLKAYAFNRFLRIFPAYYVASLLGIAVIVWATRLGVDLQALNPEFGLPHSWQGWLFPVTLLPVFGREAMPIAVFVVWTDRPLQQTKQPGALRRLSAD
jgi:peptidoglycan/LPS O-acetylase OafA/YrhL